MNILRDCHFPESRERMIRARRIAIRTNTPGGSMKRRIGNLAPLLAILIFSAFPSAAFAQTSAPAQTGTNGEGTWNFAVSGDSRNCGDVVMPAIAAGAWKNNASFYWHLGDFRKNSDFDEDIQHQPEHLAKPLSISGYQQ